MYSFVLLIIAYKALVRLKEFTAKEVLGAGIATIFFIVIVQELGSKNVNDITVITSLSFVVLYTLLFALQSRDRFSAAAFSVLLLCSFMAEACIANTDRYQMDQKKVDYASDLPDFQALKTNLDKYDGTSFYRMELTALRTRMDPCWYNYNGVSTFSSMAYEKVANLQRQLGMAGNFINSYTYNPQTPVYNAMNALKYIVNNTPNISMNQTFYQELMSKGKFTAYANRYNLPIAFCVNPAVLNWDHTFSNPFDVQSDFFSKATGVENVFDQLPITSAEYYNVDQIYSGFDTGEFYFYKTTPDTDATVTFIITPKVTQSCYIYVKSDNVDTVNVTAGNFSLSHSDGGSAILDLGVRQAGEAIRVELPIANGNSGNIDVYAYGLDTAKFVDGYNILDKGKLVVSKFTDTHILGTVLAPENCVLYTSIPYDKGWTVTVNGKNIGSSNLLKIGDAMLGIKLAKGSNTVELNYMPTGLLAGVDISASALLFLFLLLFIRRIFRNHKKEEQLIYVDADASLELPPIKPGSYCYENFSKSLPETQMQETWPPVNGPFPVKPPDVPRQETWPSQEAEPLPAFLHPDEPKQAAPPFAELLPVNQPDEPEKVILPQDEEPLPATQPEPAPPTYVPPPVKSVPVDEPEIIVEKYDED